MSRHALPPPTSLLLPRRSTNHQNRLEELPASIGRLASLSSLRLADNALTDAGVPWAALAGLTGLTLLALDRNALTALPAALGACSGLVRLSAAGNAIASIEDGALAGLAALRELDVSANALAALPEAIGERGVCLVVGRRCCCELLGAQALNTNCSLTH